MARILLAEDEFLIRLILAEELAELGHEVIEASSADEAVILVGRANHFDLLMTDIQMPGDLDGVALAKFIRQRQPAIPIIYVTGRPEALRGLSAPGPRDVVIRKPYSASEIAEVVGRLLDERQPDAVRSPYRVKE